MQTAGALLAAITGIIVCGGLVIWGAYVLFIVGVLSGAVPYHLALALLTASVVLGVVGGAWLGLRVFRWLASPNETGASF